MQVLSGEQTRLVSGGQDTVTITATRSGGSGTFAGTIVEDELGFQLRAHFLSEFATIEDAIDTATDVIDYVKGVLETTWMDAIGTSTPDRTLLPSGYENLGGINLDADAFQEVKITGRNIDSSVQYTVWLDSDMDGDWDRKWVF